MRNNHTQELAAIAQAINNHDGYWAELGDDHYLIRFGKTGVGGEDCNHVLMYDLGITWEPTRAYPTPRYCTIKIDDPEKAARNMIKIIEAELPMACPDDDAYQHLVEE